MSYQDTREQEPKIYNPAQQRKFFVLPLAGEYIDQATPSDIPEISYDQPSVNPEPTEAIQPQPDAGKADELSARRAKREADSEARSAEEVKEGLFDVPEVA